MSHQRQTLSSTPSPFGGGPGRGFGGSGWGFGFLRRFRKSLSLRIVNWLGLSVMFACMLLSYSYVKREYSYDRFHANAGRIARLSLQENDDPVDGRIHGNRLDPVLQQIPGIEQTVKLSDPHSALITHSYAQKIFGDQNPLGKTFRHSTGEILTITGIIGQISTKSMLSFDMVVSHSLSRFWSRMPYTLILLYPGVDYRQVNLQHESFFDMSHWDQHLRYQLFPLSKVYFDKNSSFSPLTQGNYSSVVLLIIVGILILLVGVINFINIYTVVVLRRGREFGIKRVFGAEGRHLFMQLWSENLLMIGASLALALVMVRLASPLITHTLQLDQIPNIYFTLAVSFLLLVALPLVTTLYPYFRYNYSTPVTSLHHIGKTKGSGGLRRIFLMFQYIFTMAMIVVSLFFIRQLQFMLHTDPGYRTRDIIKAQFLKRSSDYQIRDQEEMDKKRQNEERTVGEIEQKMDACPLFSHWVYGESPNAFYKGSFSFKTPEGEFQPVRLAGTGEKFLALFDIQLKEGRLWDDQTDNFQAYVVIVTESVLELFGITDIDDALLQPERRIWYMSGRDEEMETNPPYRIVGVVKDFNYMHLSQKSDPIVFYHSKGHRNDLLMASIVPGRTQEAIDFLKKLHDDTVGGEFTYSFVEDEVQAMYREDQKVATVYSIFTFIAIFVSALGLFGMSLFDIQQRRREIAIRKVNGASVSDIISTLLKTYFLSLAVSFIIAAPVALLAIHRYLEGFAHKAPVSWWLFAAALAVTAGISLLTLVYQTQKAANENPADVVKSE